MIRLKDRTYSKQLSDTFYLMLLQGVQYAIPLIIVPYLMIVLGAERYGYIGFATVVCLYFNTIVDFGFNMSATKLIAIAFEKNNYNEISKIFFSTLAAKLVLLVISALLCFSICFVIPQFRTYVTTVAFMFPLVIGGAFTFTFFFQGIGKIRTLSITNMISKVMVLPLTFLFVKSPDDCNLAAFIQSSVFILTAIISICVLRKYSILQKVKISKSEIRSAFKDSFPLFLSNAATTLYTNLFIVILALFASPAMVGRYSAAERIMRVCVLVISQPINQAFFPKIASLGSENRIQARKLVFKLEKIVAFIMIFISVSLFVLADVISHFLGDSYINIAPLLRIMSLAPFAISVGGIIGQMGLVAIGDNKSKRNFCKSYWIVAPISLLCVFILSPFYYEIGAAIALVITEYTVFALLYYFYRLDKLNLV